MLPCHPDSLDQKRHFHLLAVAHVVSTRRRWLPDSPKRPTTRRHPSTLSGPPPTLSSRVRKTGHHPRPWTVRSRRFGERSPERRLSTFSRNRPQMRSPRRALRQPATAEIQFFGATSSESILLAGITAIKDSALIGARRCRRACFSRASLRKARRSRFSRTSRQ